MSTRFLLAGAHSGVGKTSLSTGLMAAFTMRGFTVQPFKVGPDYIDPAFHSFVTGQKSRNLDSWLLTPETVRSLFASAAPQGENSISIIEGVMGLFDGHIATGDGSSAQVAGILQAPIILVVNGASIARSLAALVHGYNTFQPETKLAGVIINQVSGAAHYDLLRSFVEKETQVPCFGYLQKNPQLALESRHLGLIPSVEVENLAQTIDTLGKMVAETVDLDALLKLAGKAPPISAPPRTPVVTEAQVKIAIAQDKAFNFYYQDSLELLTSLGAELVPFSPLTDTCLPQGVAGLILGGGFPEIFAADLAANNSLRQDIKEKLEGGLPTYAECGGFMYLTSQLTDHQGQSHPMVGFWPGGVTMTKKLQNFGYVEVTFQEDTVLGPRGTKIRAHEFHHSLYEGGGYKDKGAEALEMRKNPQRAWFGGLARKNVLAAYPHLHFQANPSLAENFVRKCREFSCI